MPQVVGSVDPWRSVRRMPLRMPFVNAVAKGIAEGFAKASTNSDIYIYIYIYTLRVYYNKILLFEYFY